MKAHRTDGVSLVFALIFLALAGWWLLAQLLDLSLPAVGWFVAGALILIGLLGLFGALRSGRSAPADVPPTGTPAAPPVEPLATPPVESPAAPPAAAPANTETVTDLSGEAAAVDGPGWTGDAAGERAPTIPPGTDRS